MGRIDHAARRHHTATLSARRPWLDPHPPLGAAAPRSSRDAPATLATPFGITAPPRSPPATRCIPATASPPRSPPNVPTVGQSRRAAALSACRDSSVARYHRVAAPTRSPPAARCNPATAAPHYTNRPTTPSRRRPRRCRPRRRRPRRPRPRRWLRRWTWISGRVA